MAFCHFIWSGMYFEYNNRKKTKIMNKFYLFSNLFNMFDSNDGLFNQMDVELPKDGDSNFNKEVLESENETHIIKNEIWTSLDGQEVYKKVTFESKKTLSEKNIEELQSLMKEAVDLEDFEKAAELRDQIKQLKSSI